MDHNEDNAGVSGFDMGRNDIVDNWSDGGHDILFDDVWNNSQPMKQCDEKDSWSDGVVTFLDVDE